MFVTPLPVLNYALTYDPQGRVLTQTRNSQTMTFTYDAVGNRATRTDYLGHVTSYTYDDLNRLTNVGYTGASGENASYTNDDLSRLLTAVNAAGTVTFTYDNRGRLKTEEDVFGHDLEYSYDAAGRKTLLKLDASNHTAYAYDNANRLTTLTDEASNDFTFAYDNANRLTSRVMPNGVTSTYTYDNMSRLKRLKYENTSTTLYDDQFTYNTANQISQIAGLAATKNYTYDNINRLTAVTVGGSTVESYTYDAVGNRTASHLSSSYTTGAFNRVTATDSATYTYNANGSTTGKTVGAVNWTYGWDRENRMVSTGDGTNSASYQYDALGRRVKRTQGSTVEKYTNDAQDVVLDDVNSTLTKYQNGPGIDNKFKSATGGTPKYFLGDHLGSTAVISNSSGANADSNIYDAFGNTSNGGFTSRYQFTGRERDNLTGLQFSRARFYDQGLGRFISEDPIGFGGGDINIYGYVKNGPVDSRDPFGLDDGDMNPNPFSNNPKTFDWDDYYRKLKDRSDAYTPPFTKLTKCEQGWLKKYFPDVDLGEIRTYEGLPWYTRLSGEEFSAHTSSGTDIHFNPKYYNPNTFGTVTTIGHELTHVRQIRQYGQIPLIALYGFYFVKNFGYGEGIPFENDAYKNGRWIYDDLQTRNASGERPCGCNGGLTE